MRFKTEPLFALILAGTIFWGSGARGAVNDIPHSADRTDERTGEHGVEISRVSFSPESSIDPSAVVDGREVKTRYDAEFSKLGLVFAPPVRMAKFRIESCGGEFKDGLNFFFAPGWRSAFSEGGKSRATVLVPGQRPIESVAIVFRHNQNVCIKSVAIEDAKGTSIPLVATSVIAAADIEKNVDAAEKRRRTFAAHGLIDVVDRELTTKDESDNWIFRFRSDGTYFIHGFDDDYDKARAFSSVGTYEIKAATDEAKKSRKISVIMHGWRVAAPQSWDGLIDNDILKEPSEQGKSRASKVSDELLVEALKGENFMVRNRTSSKNRTLPFADLKVKLSTLDE